MKKSLLLFISSLFIVTYSFAQCTPQAVINDDFESYTAGSTAGMPTCWSSIAPFSVLMGVRDGAADSHSGSKYVNIYTFFNSNATVYVVSPELSSIDGNHFAEFYVKTAYTDVTLEYGTLSNASDGATFISAGSAALNSDNSYTHITTGNIQGNAGHKYFALKFVAPTSHSGIKIDDFSWNTGSTVVPCLAVQNLNASGITTNEATLNWNAVGNNTYDIEYGPVGFALGSGIVQSSSSASVGLSALQAQTTYDVYVTTNCGTNSADTSTKITFTTLPSPTMSIDHNSISNFKIYPNPASERINIELLGEGNFAISDLSGKVVIAGTLNSFGTTEVMINNLKQGLYILRISTTQGTSASRLVKL